MAVSLSSLLIQETKAAIYSAGLAIASAIGLPVTAWQAGDPSRALFNLEAETLEKLEEVVVGYIQSGFLDYSAGEWLKILAEQVYGVTVPDPTYATTDVVLTNAGGGVYDLEAGDLTLKNSSTGKTYHNTTGGHLAAGGTLTVTVVADEAGSDSSAAATEIDELVTTLLGVTCSNATAAIGVDAQDEAVTRQQCRDKLGSLSPGGAKEAYAYVSRNADLTGTSAITRVRVYSDSDTGDVTVYLAGPSGAVAEADRALVEEAILEQVTPLCITPTVLSASAVTINITYELWIYQSVGKSAADIKADIETALESMFAARPIGGDIVAPATSGKMYTSLIDSTIRSVFSQAFRVSVTVPASDTALTNGQVAALGTVTGTVHIEKDP